MLLAAAPPFLNVAKDSNAILHIEDLNVSRSSRKHGTVLKNIRPTNRAAEIDG